LVYADDVNTLSENIITTNKSKEVLWEATKELGLEVNIRKTKHMGGNISLPVINL